MFDRIHQWLIHAGTWVCDLGVNVWYSVVGEEVLPVNRTVEHKLDCVEEKLDHVHDMLHALTDLVIKLQPASGGMSSDEVAKAVAQLTAVHAKFQGIINPPSAL